MKKGLLVVLLVVAAAAAGVGAYYRYGRKTAQPELTTLPVSRGDIAEVVGATGTIEALTTVQVGTQVSGTIQSLSADFNSIVRKGQVIARLDPSLFETQTAQGRANLVRAQADVERQRVALDDAQSKLARAKNLATRGLIPAIELETAEATVSSAQAQLRSAQAQVVQAQASLNQSTVNLQHTVIEAPIDGIVISRNVDVGQTVAASMQAPTLFVIAADLTKMRVVADVDESDVGRIRPGQVVRFRVDAYPNEEFSGTVALIRLQPKVSQNVVTYATVIDVPNRQLKLKPGMTATVSLEIARKADAIRIPVAALRFRPSAEIFAALNQPVPPELQGGAPQRAGGAGGTRGTPAMANGTPSVAAEPAPASARSGAPSPQASAPPAARRGAAAEGQGGGRRRPRSDAASDGGSPDASADARPGLQAERRNRAGASGRSPGEAARAPARDSTVQTIDSLFGPLPVTETTGRVWRYDAGQLKPVRVRLGISDGAYTELIAGDLEPGAELVSAVILPTQGTSSSTAGRSPLIAPGRGPGGGPGGGGPRPTGR